MRRFLAFAVLFALSFPVGLSITGCGHNPNNYCIKNGHAYGMTTSQVAYATLQPETTGLSLAWGQTGTLGSPQAFNCNGGSASVAKWYYASSNLLLGDISPSGIVCAGTWNRNSPGGVPNFTICTPPSGSTLTAFKSCASSACGTVQVTATGGGVTTNPVNIYIHPPITAITIPSQSSCVSQGQTLVDAQNNPLSLLSETTVQGPGGAVLCSPTTVSCTSPSANIGTIEYAAVTGSVVNINNTTNPTSVNPVTGNSGGSAGNPNGTATANLPGSTVINATTSDVTSAAGYFSTCSPKNIALSINGSTSATVTASSPQTVVANVTDTKGNTITGLSLTYASTEPQNLTVSSAGLVTAAFPSHATITAVCQPPGCNPAPVNLIGTLGNGMPVAGNPVAINSPGRVSNQIWMASSQAPYFSEIDLTTGGLAAPVRMPYTPNSMIMDQGGDTLYFGSYHELMVYTTNNNQLAKEDPSVPGVVLAVNPAGNQVVVNDQLRQVIYLYSPTGGIATSFAGVAFRAQYSPDGSTVYIDGYDPAKNANALFVHNTESGWTEYPQTNQPSYSSCQLEALGPVAAPAYNPAWDPFCGPSLTITVPSVATFLSGNSTVARSYCASASSNPPYFPLAGGVANATQQLTATPDGNHILGADGSQLVDIWLTHTATGSSQPAPGVPIGACPDYTTGTPLTLATNANSGAMTIAPTEIDQVVASPDSSLAFVTYNTSYTTPTGGGVLPYYQPSGTMNSFGSVGQITLSGNAGDPVAGAFSPDGSIFFVSTDGDNLIHEVTTTGGTPVDSGTTLNPQLTNANGQAVPAQFLAVKSRSTT